jgi:transcriptional regulator with XRE-family HTH domain
MASALTRFGQYCRDLRSDYKKSMGDQGDQLGCAVHYISSIETGRIAPSMDYIEKFRTWLNLSDSQYQEAVKRSRGNVVSLQDRASLSNNCTSMRLFRKISKMDSDQIRKLGKKIQSEVQG